MKANEKKEPLAGLYKAVNERLTEEASFKFMSIIVYQEIYNFLHLTAACLDANIY